MEELEISSVGSKRMNFAHQKQMRFNLDNDASLQPKKAHTVASDLDTEDRTVKTHLHYTPAEELTHSVQEPSINVANIPTQNQQTSIERYRKYEKVMIKAFSKTHPPMPDHQSSKKVVIIDVEGSELSNNSSHYENIKQTSNEYKKSRQSIALRLSKPSVLEQKNSSLKISGYQDYLFLGTDSMIVNSVNSQEESVTNQFLCSKKIKSNNDYRRRPVENENDYVETKQKSKLIHPRGEQTHFQPKSQKKVTFIGDNSVIETEGGMKDEPQFREKSETVNSIKDSGSMTSILYHHSAQKKSLSQQGSRKIISQDDNYCLFRLMGSAKFQRLLMCRSVEIKDEMIEYKELKLYLLSRENEHRNIVKMHSYEKVMRENRLFVEIKMDYYPKNLEEYILQGQKNEKRIRFQRKIILFQILKAINFIHCKGIYHRDLNPHNIMMTDRLHVGLTNFAYAKQTPTPFSSDNFYECNCYIRPPEVILQPCRGFESGGDIWGFGCIVVYMLKGQMPFFKEADAQLMLQIVKMLGPPTAKYLESINFKDHKRFFFPRAYRKSLRTISGCEEPDLLQMLKNIFRYQPAQRPTAAELMGSQFFADLRDESTFRILAKSYQIEGLFDFKQSELSKEDIANVVPLWYPPLS